jgi:hypothetical protein
MEALRFRSSAMPIALSGPALCGVDEAAMRSTQLSAALGRRSNDPMEPGILPGLMFEKWSRRPTHYR